MFVVVFNNNVLSSNSSSNSYLRQHWSKGKKLDLFISSVWLNHSLVNLKMKIAPD